MVCRLMCIYCIAHLISNMGWEVVPYDGFPHLIGNLIANDII